MKITDITLVELAASFMVWISSPEAAFLKGKFVWSNWDVDELISKKEELLSTPALTLGLIGISPANAIFNMTEACFLQVLIPHLC
jgi:hypothetical protein